VVATGDCQKPHVPGFARNLPDSIHQVVPSRYRNPDQLPDGGVLVVGASATGLQLAVEIHKSGRPVTLAVGRHTRMPRTYRGRDVMAWLDEMGVLNQRAEDVRDLSASRAQPSLQLVGTPNHATLDLDVAQRLGIRLAGRARLAMGTTVHFEDNLVEDVVAADLKLVRLLLRIDEHIERSGQSAHAAPEARPPLVDVDDGPRSIDLGGAGIRTVLWATGFRRSYPWLHVPVVTDDGEIVHEGGITPVPGVYVMGLRFLRRRSSSFIDGQARDAEEIADHILEHRASAVAVA
jgi:putative flavoprotein involved in K+ transport